MRTRHLLFALLGLAAVAAARPAIAQQSLTCSSDDGNRHYCNADTRGGVQMVRQRSDARCDQGYSWGYDQRGVWVDHGCRADFAVNAPGQWNNGGSQTVTCSSDDGNRHYCNADTRSGSVQMTHQRSDARCQQGYSWGYDQRGIWVDHGCRADFVVTSGWGWNNGSGNGQAVTCSSDDGNRHYCNADTSGGVRMTNQRSDAQCQQGYSWGYDQRGIWVDHGCRADFITTPGYGGGPGWNNGGNGGGTITCSSDDGGRHYCPVPTRRGVQMVNKRSDARCDQGYSWGYDRAGIWVDHGCRADFVVR